MRIRRAAPRLSVCPGLRAQGAPAVLWGGLTPAVLFLSLFLLVGGSEHTHRILTWGLRGVTAGVFPNLSYCLWNNSLCIPAALRGARHRKGGGLGAIRGGRREPARASADLETTMATSEFDASTRLHGHQQPQRFLSPRTPVSSPFMATGRSWAWPVGPRWVAVAGQGGIQETADG